MPRYLLKIKARDKTGKIKNFWCVFSTIVMSCISPIVEAADIGRAKDLLSRFKFMGISDLEREAVEMGFLTEEDVKQNRMIVEMMRSEPSEADELIRENWDIISKYSSAIDEVEKRLGVKGYNDRYVEEVEGEVEDGTVTAWMKVYEYAPPKL